MQSFTPVSRSSGLIDGLGRRSVGLVGSFGPFLVGAHADAGSLGRSPTSRHGCARNGFFATLVWAGLFADFIAIYQLTTNRLH
jgi:hypothetical protein